jgi:hypothetical protein
MAAAMLATEAATGLWIYFAPFSILSQIQVLIHAALGTLLLIPCAWRLAVHGAVWWRQKMTATMILGWALAAMTLACFVSGGVLTWRAAFGPRRPDGWAYVHLFTGLAVAGLLPAHLIGAWRRRSAAAARDEPLARARQVFVWRLAGWSGLAMASVVGISAFLSPSDMEVFPPPEDYAFSEHFEQFEEFRGRLFAPSNARVEGDLLVASSVLAGSESCGSAGCHEQILREWQPSAHRFSAMNPPFQAIQKNFAADRGAIETRYCAGCHDPISLFAGAKNIHNQDLSAPGMDEGISCAVCHSISQVDQDGNADYALAPPRKYLWEGAPAGEWRKLASDFLIRALSGPASGRLRPQPAADAGILRRLPQAADTRGSQPLRDIAGPEPA